MESAKESALAVNPMQAEALCAAGTSGTGVEMVSESSSSKGRKGGIRSRKLEGTRADRKDLLLVERTRHKHRNNSRKKQGCSILGDYVEAVSEPIIFDSINIQFHFDIFLRQLVAHIIFFLAPFCIENLMVQGFFNWKNLLGVQFNVLHALTVYVIIALYFMSDVNTSSSSKYPETNAIGGIIVFPILYWFQHKCLVAFKYASLSRSEYCKIASAADLTIGNAFMQQIQILTAWLWLEPNVVMFELGASAARIGARINKINFVVENPENSSAALGQFRLWNCFLRGHDVVDFTSPTAPEMHKRCDGNYSVSVDSACLALLNTPLKRQQIQFATASKCIFIFATLNTAIPFIMFVAFYPFNSVSKQKFMIAGALLMCTAWLNFMYSALFYQLLYVSIADATRQTTMYSELSYMLRLTDLMMISELDVSTYHATKKSTPGSGDSRGFSSKMPVVSSAVASIPPFAELPLSDVSASKTDLGARTTGEREGYSGEAASDGDNTVSSDLVNEDFESASVISTEEEVEASSVIGEEPLADNDPARMPRLWMGSEQNIMAWTHARLALQYFGIRFRSRLETAVALGFIMVSVLMAVAIVDLSVVENPLNRFQVPVYIQLVLNVAMAVGFLLIITIGGSKVNEILEDQTRLLSSHTLRLQRKVSILNQRMSCASNASTAESMKQEVERLGKVMEALESMKEVVECSTEFMPYKIFGMRAQSAMISSILTVSFTFFSTIVGILTGGRTGADGVVA